MKFRSIRPTLFAVSGLILATGMAFADSSSVADTSHAPSASNEKVNAMPTAAVTDSQAIATTPESTVTVRRTRRARAPKVDSPPREALTIHPISSIAVSGFSLSYEFPFRSRLALEVPAHFGINSRLYEQGRLFVGSGLGLRLYLTHPDYGGYVSPSFEFLNMQFFKEENEPGGNTFVTLAWLRYGYKFLWPHFTLDVGGGFGWGQTFGGSPSGPTDTPISGFIPMGHFALGIPFGGPK